MQARHHDFAKGRLSQKLIYFFSKNVTIGLRPEQTDAIYTSYKRLAIFVIFGQKMAI